MECQPQLNSAYIVFFLAVFRTRSKESSTIICYDMNLGSAASLWLFREIGYVFDVYCWIGDWIVWYDTEPEIGIALFGKTVDGIDGKSFISRMSYVFIL